MKRGLFICLLVFGFTHATEDNIGAETKDITSKDQVANINFKFFDKSKRGAVKITNADNPSFNHLSSGVSSPVSSGGFKPSTATTSSNVAPARYLYNQLYYQPNPYLTYVQLPQAAQIAAQYSIQSNPVTHFLQTPNQIQYVATPTVAQVPQIKYQTFANEYSRGNIPTSDSSSSSAINTQYISQSQQSVASPQIYTSSASSPVGSSQIYATSSGSSPVGSSQIYATSSGSSAAASSHSASTVSQAKQVQVPFYSSAQPVYYTQQPLLTYFPQAQTANFIYQQPNANFILKHQQQLASLYGPNRFGLYTPTQNTQLTYLVPMVVSQPEQDSTTTTTSLKSSDKTVSNVQQSASTNSFSFGTKP